MALDNQEQGTVIDAAETCERYTVDYSETTIVNFPKVRFSVQQVVVVLGANGVGKSRLLNDMKLNCHSLFGGRRAMSVEGARLLDVRGSIAFSGSIPTPSFAKEKYSSGMANKIHDRLPNAMLILIDRGSEIALSLHEDVMNQRNSGEAFDAKDVSELPMNMFMNTFSSVYPDIKLSFDNSTRRLKCTKYGHEYDPEYLSDGEKQAFSLLADAHVITDSVVVFADEPELNLHPLLASRLWDAMERLMPNSIFIYATHSINFALRPNVDSVVVLSQSGGEVFDAGTLHMMDKESLRDFLGAIPAILVSDKILVVEGIETAFDQAFYSLLVAPSVRIVPLESCHEVISAATKMGIWKKVSAGVKIIGIVDRDYLSDEQVEGMTEKIIVLEFHEAESYLCHPDVLMPILDQVAGGGDEVRRQIEKCICEFFEAKLRHVVLTRISKKVGIYAPSLSVERRSVPKIGTDEDFINAIKISIQRDRDRIFGAYDDDKLEQLIHDELLMCRSAMEERDLHRILQLVPGKQLQNKILEFTPLRRYNDVLNVVRKHNLVESISILSKLRDQIDQRLNLS